MTRGAADHRCTKDFAKIYVQYTCMEDYSYIVEKRKVGVLVAALFLCMAAFFNIYMYKREKESIIQFKEWDLDTVTVTDFAVMMNIPDKVWKNFIKNNDAKDFSAEL